MQILDHMATTISEVRPELSKFAPKVVLIRINPEKIRDVIGSGGKVINEIIEKCNGVKIDIEQDGRVFIMHSDSEWIEKAKEMIENLTREVEIGETYDGVVVKIMEFGAFVQLWPGVEGMVHVSELDNKRVEKVTDFCKEGDKMTVKVLGIDDKGKIKLSHKALLPKASKESDNEAEPKIITIDMKKRLHKR